MWIDYLPLLIAIPLHELGHYIGYRIFNYKPSLRFTPYGILIGENVHLDLKPIQAYIITVLGILAGYFYLWFLHGPIEVVFLYFVLCSIDIVNIINIFNVKKEWMQMNFLEISKLQLKEMEEKHGKR